MRYGFRNPSSPKSSLSFISFDSILQFFSVNIALTSPTISFLSVVYCTKNRYHTNFFASHERMGHLLLIAVVHLLNPLYVDAFSVRDHLLSLNTCTMYLEIAVEVRPSTKKSIPIQFVHTRLCKISRQEHLDLIQKFFFSICENQ